MAPERVARHLHALPRRAYPFRILGMGLAGLPLGVVLLELAAPWPAWAWLILSCLLWPHLAYAHARLSADPVRAELRNFMTDSFIAGSWPALLHFNLLPSAVLLSVVTADKINTGVRGLWVRSLPGMAIALVGFGLFTGYAFRPETSLRVLLACLPIMVIHTLAVSWSSYKLVRRVQAQNLQLEELSRIDALTGLQSRPHFEANAEALLRAHRDEGAAATLVLVDVDRFKEINDRYGHAVGDDVLRAIAERLRASMPPGSHAGRLGGDEFALAMPVPAPEAARAAETVRAVVESLEFPRTPGLRCSVSLGLAAAPDGVLGLREWTEAADRALYDAKHAGRNRAAGVAPPA